MNESFPTGLTNLGNTCFINSVLQSLANCDLFYHHIKKSLHKRSCNKQNDCVRCALEECIMDMRSSLSSSQSQNLFYNNNYTNSNNDNNYNNNPSTKVLRILPLISQNDCFTFGQQGDAHEFLVNLLLGMKQSFTNLDYNYPKLLFEGNLISQVYCFSCNQISAKSEPIDDIELNISQKSTIQAALNEYCSIEDLYDGNMYCCATCGIKTNAQKCLKFSIIPDILRIQFKRFAYDRNEFIKINHFVEYPLLLDMNPYIYYDQ
eukprot:gene10046-13505_t